MCPRNVNGKKINPDLIINSITLDWVKSHISLELINNLKKVTIIGSLGDPASCTDLIPIINYIKQHNNNCVIGLNSNGGLRSEQWWADLAGSLNGIYDYTVFSIDGLEDTNHLYRRNVNWRKLIANVSSYINAGGKAHWDMLIFEHNKHQIDNCLSLAKQLGFTWFRTKLTDRWDMYDPNIIGVFPAEEYLSIDYNNITNIICEKERDNSLYLDSNKNVWPCCHLSEAHASKNHHDKDVKKYSADELLTVYKEKLDTTPFYTCKRTCGILKKTTVKRSQWKKEIQIK